VADNPFSDPGDSEGEVAGRPARTSSGIAAQRESAPARLVGFLRGSVRELQRVQWPDRRQVMQATGVVLGFVIVAGIFLGVADLVASKLVNLVLK
jgi:preprotein translocase subunit SecE